MITLVVYAGKIRQVRKVFSTRLIPHRFAWFRIDSSMRKAIFASPWLPNRARGWRSGFERRRHESGSFH